MKQKIIKIGSSIGIVMPKFAAEEHGYAAGQEVASSFNENGDFVVHKQANFQNKELTETVRRATAYIEKYRKDFEALADK
jgi:antitoxin component of MazEF toxin-antitoxin module